MKSLKNPMGFNYQTAKKYVLVMAVASVASFTSLASLAVFAEPADAGNKAADTAPHHKHDYVDGNCGDRKLDDGRHGHRKHDDRKHGWNEDRPRFGAKLNLTDDQKKTLADARTAQEPAMRELHEKLRVAHEALINAGDNNADDVTLTRLAKDVSELRTQQELARISMHKQFVSVLTPEQKQTLDSLKAQRKDKSSQEKSLDPKKSKDADKKVK